jgi:serine/threonine protein kinase/WD40 repeat protein
LPDRPALVLADELARDDGHEAERLGAEQPGDIGRYKLLQKLGEGGYGIVYLAEQRHPVRRKVALKVIKLGMDTRSVVARFEAERQALAMMEHPNIAKVLDAGSTETGRPYFVMELVRGLRITKYCDENRLSTRQRLALFIQICKAVQHAHQKGVIHRDLKPSNILVTERDGVPIPKVIDFGIAKATGNLQLTDKTVFTAFEQFIGTPAYMSPEQASSGELDIDTRSDIYSLGVLLYELLTGQPPFDNAPTRGRPIDEVLKNIREKDPLRPSTRLLAMTELERTKAAYCRRAESTMLPRLLRGDLDWIVMKCLEKDRSRRFETANGLAMDIQRYLANETITARPPSRLYEFQKTVRRHKFGFLATAGVVMALTFGLCVSALETARARRAEKAQALLEQKSEREASKALAAEAEARDKLRGSYRAEAQALRWSRRAGRRSDGLQLLQKAAEIRPGIDLRNEAIACMALTDLRVDSELHDERSAFSGIAFDAHYERYAVCDAKGTVHLCRVKDSQELIQLPGYRPPLPALAFSPNGRFFCAGYRKERERVEVFDLITKEPRLQLDGPGLRTAEFSGDSRLIAVAYELPAEGYPVKVFDLELRQQIGTFRNGSLPYYLRFDPTDPQRLLISDESSTVCIRAWTNGSVLKTFPHPGGVIALDWHPGGELVATGCSDNRVRVWNTTTAEKLAEFIGHEATPVEVSFSADGEFVASRGWEGILRLWNLYSSQEVVNRKVYGYGYPLSRKCQRLAITSGVGKFEILDLTPGEGFRVLHVAQDPNNHLRSCDFDPQNQLLVTSTADGVAFWNLHSGKEAAKIEKAGQTPFALFDPNGTNLFLTTKGGIEEWVAAPVTPNLPLQPTRRRRIDLRGCFSQLSLSQDGRTLAAATDHALHLLNVETGEEVRRLTLKTSEVLATMSLDARLAATWTRTSTNLQVWDTFSSQLVQLIPTCPSTFAAFSHDSRWLIVGDEVEFRMWDTRNWRTTWTLPRDVAGHYGYAAFSQDDRMLAVAISRSTVRLVDPANGHEYATLEDPDPLDIEWITFNRHGTDLAVANGSGTVQLWNLRRIRRQLASMKLDWDLPPYP